MDIAIIFVTTINYQHTVTEQQSNQALIQTLFNHRKGFGLIISAFFIVVMISTYLSPKQYTASAIVYPTLSNSIKKEAINPVFGFETQSDRLIQLLYSQQMQEAVVEQFELMEYYKLDTNRLEWRNELNKNYQSDIHFKRTQYLSVEISAEFNDAYLSTDIVNFMVTFIDTIRRDIFIKNTQIWVTDLESKVIPQEEIVDGILLEIFESKETTLSNYLSQNTEINISARQENATILHGDKVIKQALKTNYSLRIEKLVSRYYLELGVLNRYQTDLINGKEKLNAPFPQIYTVRKAQVDQKKTSPSFLVNGIMGLVMGVVVALLYYLGRQKWKEIYASLS